IHLPNVPVTDIAINPQAGVLRVSTFGRGAFQLARASGPVISVNAQNGLDFDTVCAGTSPSLTLQVFNVGTQDLVINSVQRLFGSSEFTVLPNPGPPLVISPTAEVDFPVRFTPAAPPFGPRQATIRISSSDPGAPTFDLTASADVEPGDIRISGSTNFGDVCAGAAVEKTVSVCNVGVCNLHVNASLGFCP